MSSKKSYSFDLPQRILLAQAIIVFGLLFLIVF